MSILFKLGSCDNIHLFVCLFEIIFFFVAKLSIAKAGLTYFIIENMITNLTSLIGKIFVTKMFGQKKEEQTFHSDFF